MNDQKQLIVKFHEIPIGGLELHYSSKEKGLLDPILSDLLGTSPTYDVLLNLNQIEQMTQVKGQIHAEVPFECSRCAEDFKAQINKNFATLYYKSDSDIKTLQTPSDDINDLDTHSEMELLPSGVLDLGEAIHEHIGLEIPFQPLCSESCKGLCSQCGENLNTIGAHEHPEYKFKSTSPFAKLGESN